VKKTILLFLMIFLCFAAEKSFGQQKQTVSGYVKDAASGEELIGANILVEELKTGGISNIYGFYSLTLPKGNYTITASYLGYNAVSQKIISDGNVKMDFSLEKTDNELQQVEVRGERIDKNVTSTETGTEKLSILQIKKIPSLMGETDIIKSIQLLPGIQSAGEGSSGFHVRGGGVDQNLILLDDATVYNSSHLFGFFSVFNQDAVKDVKIFKGGIPAQYGGRLASLLDIRLKEGNMKHFEATGGIGILSSRLTVEGPIIKDKMSFIVSARRTYFDLFFPFLKNDAIKQAKIFFYDLSAKINYKIDDKNRIFLSTYDGNDVMKFSQFFQTNYGNKTATLRYNHLFSASLFSNTTFIYSDFNYGIGVPTGSQAFNWISDIIDYSVKNDFTKYFSTGNTVNFGFGLTQHTFKPGNMKPLDNSFFTPHISPDNHALDYFVYADQKITITHQLSAEYGLRVSVFQNSGKSTFYTFNKSNPQEYTPIDTIHYNGGIINTYWEPEPRANLVFKIDSSSSVKASYNRMTQYLQLATNSNAPTPYDFWFPSSKNIKPQKGDQVSLGYFRNFSDNLYETSFEVYYKKMYNVIDFRDHANIYLNDLLEGEVRSGNAYSYGAEVMIKKQTGKFTGWLSYTYSRTFRKIPEINNGNQYMAPYDCPNNISVVLSYDINPKINVSLNWVYSTGAPRTMPIARVEYQGLIVPVYSDRNAVRIPDYHRADVSITYQFGHGSLKSKRYSSNLNFSIYNVYNRHNTYSIIFQQNKDNPNTIDPQKMYLFPLFPALTYNFEFK
jgi:hypothetical protein